MNKFLSSSKRKDCLLAVSNYMKKELWSSSFYLNTLRNFFVNPTNSTSGEPFQAFQTAIHPTNGMTYSNDFRVEIKFKLIGFTSATSYSLLYQSGGRIQIFFAQRADGLRRLSFTSSAVSGADLFTPYLSMQDGEYTVIAEVIGSTVKLTINGTEYSLTGTRVDNTATDPNRVINSNGNWNILSLKLTNLTTSTVLYNYGTFYNSDAIFPTNIIRNFYTNSITWTEANSFYKSVGLGDIRVSYKYLNRAIVPSRGFLSGLNLSGYLSSSPGTTSVVGANIVSNGASYTFPTEINKTFEIVIERVSGVFKIFINGVAVVTRSGGTYVDLSTLTGNIVSEHDGNIIYFKIENLTTSTSWQAREDQLFIPSTPLRDNAVENNRFYGFGKKWLTLEDGAEFDFEIDFEITSWPTSAQYVFSNQGTSPARFECVTISSSGNLQFYVNTMSNPIQINVNSVAKRYKCKIEVRSSQTKLYIDNAVVGTYDNVRTFTNGGLYTFLASFGIIHEVTLKKKDGTVLYDFPTFEEKIRLITKTNAIAYDGYFTGAYQTASATSSNLWGLRTALNLKNMSIESTGLCKVYFSGSFTSGVAEQQFAIYSGVYSIKMRQETTNVTTLSASAIIRRTDTGASYPISASFTADQNYLNKWMNVGVRIDSISGTFNLYVDGVLKATASIPSYAKYSSFYSTTDAFLIIGNTGDGGACRQDLAKVENFSFFNRALTEDEIKSLI